MRYRLRVSCFVWSRARLGGVLGLLAFWLPVYPAGAQTSDHPGSKASAGSARGPAAASAAKGAHFDNAIANSREPIANRAASAAKGARFGNWVQLPTAILPLGEAESERGANRRLLERREIPGRRLPAVVLWSGLDSPELAQRAVPLPEANTLAHLNYQQRRFGRLQAPDGRQVRFNPEVVLVKFRALAQVAALGLEPGRELAAARALAARPDVDFAELDIFERRAFWPDDPLITNQWHHQVIGSYAAWDWSLGQAFVRIAIVDTPFQMDHPDLAPHTASGWDVVANEPVTASSGIEHSTLGAGLAAAVIDNGLGVAGASNCQVLPININGALSEMYNAVIWAADHGVRVVNISWTGGDSDTLNAAGSYLKTNALGILAMPGGNLGATPYVTNQPDIYCISMTDRYDNMQSLAGPQVDFAAPGWGVYSTTTNNGYAFCSGTSFSTPLFCGVVAVLLSINPTLGPEDVIAILKRTALDKGPPGWDMWFGWGRIDFGAAAAAAAATLPRIDGVVWTNHQVVISTSLNPGLTCSLWRSATLPAAQWMPVTNAVVSTNGPQVLLLDPTPPAGGQEFYRLGARR